jgi:TolB protein
MRILYGVIILLFTSCAASKKSIEQLFNESNYAIAYNVATKDVNNKTNYEIFVKPSIAEKAYNITNNKDVAWTYFADDSTLYFISDRDTCYRCFFLYKTGLQSNANKISNLQLEDSWMDINPSKTKMLVSGRIGKTVRHQLFEINLKDGSYQQKTFDTAAHFRDPAYYGPNQIATIYRSNKRDTSIWDEVYKMAGNFNLSGLQKLTSYPITQRTAENKFGYTAGAIKARSTSSIAYISKQDGQHYIFEHKENIFKKNTNKKLFPFVAGWFSFSKDGKWLVYDAANADESQYHIYLYHIKSKQTLQITDNTFKYHQSPVFVLKK